MSDTLRRRGTAAQTTTPNSPSSSSVDYAKPRHGPLMQLFRIVGFGIYFFGTGIFIHLAQLLGLPLYLYNRDWFHAWIALTKQFFGILITTMTQWWSPTLVRISGDKSMAGLLHQDASGLLTVDFGDRVVLMANHQIYTDWLYLWWIAYTNSLPMHGHIYIILKASLKWVPLIGPAMQLYGFIFMARKWATDQETMRYRLQKLNSRHSQPLTSSRSSAPQLDPMWLMIFPEGTNLSANTYGISTRYAEKTSTPMTKHCLLPRHTGLQFCLQELRSTVPYVYDCTIAYEGTPPSGFAAERFGLRSVYFQGLPPKSVNMHCRRFPMSSIPIDDEKKMAAWTLDRWREKDELLERFGREGKFPADKTAVNIEDGPQEDAFKTAYINTEVRTRSPVELGTVFVPVMLAATVGRIGVQIMDRVFGK